MKTWLKRSLLGGLVLLLVLSGIAYYQLKSIGIIPKRDYDTVAPALPAFEKPAVLVFSKTNGFIHKDAIPVAKKIFAKIIQQEGWQPFITDNAAVHSLGLLQRFDVIIWNNVSGDVLTAEQRSALVRSIMGSFVQRAGIDRSEVDEVIRLLNQQSETAISIGR